MIIPYDGRKKPLGRCDRGENPHMRERSGARVQLALTQLVVVVEPKGFQSIEVKSSAPGTSNSEQLFMDDLSILLVGGDDHGQDTAVEDELHHQVLVVGGVKVGRDYWLQNRFVRNKVASKTEKSSSCLNQSRTS